MKSGIRNTALLILLTFSFIGSSFAQPQSSVKHPSWAYDKVIYEVNLRQFTQSGSIKEFSEHLPRLKELGVGILWLMPVHPIGELNRKGTMGSYYSVKDYLAVDPYYGTSAEFKALVKEIHKMGMYVIIDWVANHTAWDNPLLKSNPEFYSKDSLGKFIPPVADWSDVVDLDYNNAALREYMIKALEFWVKEYDIDGFRCDVAGMVPMDFWDAAAKGLNKIKHVFMLAEAEDPELHLNAFNMSYGWDLHHIMNKVAKGEANATEVLSEIKRESKRFPQNAMRMRFITNHDENSWNGTEFERMGDAVEAMAALSYLVPGMPLIYTGQEVGLNKRLNFFEKDPVEWKESKYTEFYTKLNKLKKVSSALQNGEKGGAFEEIKNNNANILTFSRVGAKEVLLGLFNLSKTDASSNLKIPAPGIYEDYFTGEQITVANEFVVSLKPWEYKILHKVR